MLLQHLLVFILIVVFPLWDRYEIPRLKASTDPEKRVRFYWKIIAAEWVCAAVAFLTLGLATLFTIRTVPGDLPLLSGKTGSSFLAGLVTSIAVVLLLPAILPLFSAKLRAKAAKAAQPLAYLLPWSPRERLWWWPVCITAGICEEVLYRGFLLHYLHTAPFHLSLTWALGVGAVIFGIGHIYQGVKGAASIAVLGFVLGMLFVVTGSLLIPILAHAAMDLRVLLLLPPGTQPEAASGS